MIMDEKTIKETLLKGERVTLECKKAQSNVPVNADLMLNSVLKVVVKKVNGLSK